MGFHNVVLPEKFLSVGSATGPGHQTYTGEGDADSGLKQRRVERWPHPRAKLDIVAAALTRADAFELFCFVNARHGSAFSFLVKNPQDFTTTGDVNNPTPTASDVHLGNDPAGNRLVYDLRRMHGAEQHKIRRPIPGTVTVSRNDDVLTEGEDFVVDHFLGKVFILTPQSNTTITAGCQFYTKVRFDKSVGDNFSVTAEDFEQFAASIPMVEDQTEELWVENKNDGTTVLRDLDRAQPLSEKTISGGGTDFHSRATTQPIQLKFEDGPCISVSADTQPLALYLPLADPSIPPGGPHFVIANVQQTKGTDNYIDLWEWTSVFLGPSAPIESRPRIPPGEVRMVWFDGDSNKWRAI